MCVCVCVCGGGDKVDGVRTLGDRVDYGRGRGKKSSSEARNPKTAAAKSANVFGRSNCSGPWGNGPRMEKGNTQKGRAPKAKAHREVQKGMIANERMQKGRIAKEKIANERGRKGKIPREQKKAWR